MKFFHLSDLHIGLKLLGRDLLQDQAAVLDQVISLAREHRPDAVVIAGDLYDRAVPSAEAVQLFDAFLTGLSESLPEAVIMLISGNHDSAPRVNLFRSVLSGQNIYMIGMPPMQPEEHIEKVTLRDDYGAVHFYLLPFVRPSMVRRIVGEEESGGALSYDECLHALIEREEIDQSERNVLVSHQFYLPCGQNPDEVERMESEILTVGNIDSVRADVLEAFDYAALGHIHKPMKVGSEAFRYCGTPLACSVSEAGQQKGVLMVTMGEKGKVETQVLALTPPHQVRVIRGNYREVLNQGCQDYVTVVLTDQTDLDVIDMQDRIRNAFPNLLEIRRETQRRADYGAAYTPQAELDPFSLCCQFLKDLDEEEQEVLRDVIRAVTEVQ